MALEAVVYPQDPFSYSYKDYYSLICTSNWSNELGTTFQEDDHDHKAHIGNISDNNIDQQGKHGECNWDSSSPSIMQQHAKDHWAHPNSSSPCPPNVDQSFVYSTMTSAPPETATTTTTGRRKRRRTRSTKNKEEIENQRMTHIAVERNRRKQMNEYLAMLRSLMPPSYVQRGDQASIIGGAINFVKELEQLVQTMEAQKKMSKREQEGEDGNGFLTPSRPFADFFTFPQYTTRGTQACMGMASHEGESEKQVWAMADIEVTMVESHANLKILSKQRHRQLLKLVTGLHSLRLSVLHVNVTAVHQLVLYSFSVKVEEGCHLNTVDEIAAAVNQMIQRFEEEAVFSR